MCANAQLTVIGRRDRHQAIGISPLHRDMAAASAHLDESVSYEKAPNRSSRQGVRPSQPQPRSGSPRPSPEGDGRLPRRMRSRQTAKAPQPGFRAPPPRFLLGWPHRLPGKAPQSRRLPVRRSPSIAWFSRTFRDNVCWSPHRARTKRGVQQRELPRPGSDFSLVLLLCQVVIAE